MRYDPDHKTRTRSRVLGEAARAIRVQGPHRVGVAEVMAKAGLTHGGFYAHFASKDELLAAAVARMFDDALAAFYRLTKGKSPAEALRAYLDMYLSTRHRDAPASGCPMPSLAADVPRLDPAAREQFARGVSRLTVAFAGLLSALGHADPEGLAWSAFAEMVGALSLARGLPDPTQSEAILRSSRDRLKARLGIEGKR